MLECFIKFFNKHAYTEIALTGNNFCASASKAMGIIVSNALRFGVMHGLGEIIMTFAEISITSAVMVCAYYMILYIDLGDKNAVTTFLPPLTVNNI